MLDSRATSASALVLHRAHAPAIVRVVDVDVDLVVDCVRPRLLEKTVALVGVATGCAIAFPLLDWAVAASPLASALALVALGTAVTAVLRRAEERSLVGLGAALVARGVAVDVAAVFVRAERAAPLRQHLMAAPARAALLRETALRLVDDGE